MQFLSIDSMVSSETFSKANPLPISSLFYKIGFHAFIFSRMIFFSINECNETLAYHLAHCILLYVKIHTNNKNHNMHIKAVQ